MDSDKIIAEFKHHTTMRIAENIPRIENCLARLSEEAVWQKPGETLNSVANLILHLCGNTTQYILSSMGGEADNRMRDEEFAATGGYTKAQLFDTFSATVHKACAVINAAPPEELMRMRKVQGYSYSGMGNIIHVSEHLSYHTGQIAFITKLLTNTDLGFYAGLDLNSKNEV